ncbi:MAG: ABC transporter substrate-binding protein [Firmicutes bacterium]|nr:ABC transporter substrate-binding protein [Bacillota bacterium]
MDDINALSMDATALTTAAMAGSVDAVAAWSPYTLTIMEEMGDKAVKLCENIDFETLVSPASWVVNPGWAEENEETIVKFLRAILKGMDYGSNPENFEEIAEYQAAVIASTTEELLAQQYDGDWLSSARIAGYLESGEMLDFYRAQQTTFVNNGVLEAEGLLTPEEFVLTDLLEEALAE